jgi:hypothetical protein
MLKSPISTTLPEINNEEDGMKITFDITYRKGPEYSQSEHMVINFSEDDCIRMAEIELGEGYLINAPKIRELKIKAVDFS